MTTPPEGTETVRVISVTRAVVAAGLIAAGAFTTTAAADTTPVTHSPKVTTNCWPAGHSHAAEVIIYNGKQYGTGWMYGWRVNAVTKNGSHLTRIFYTGDTFRIKAWDETGGVTWFDPHRLASCTAVIIWAS